MIDGERVCLRPIGDDDWPLVASWAQRRDGLWGAFQRHQLDHLPTLRQAYQHGGLLSREAALLLIERRDDRRAIGYVRYTLSGYPDADLPQPDIGFGLAEPQARGLGLGREAVALLVGYLWSGYPCERISAVTDAENEPARRLLTGLGFRHEGTLRRSSFRDGEWRDMALYGLLRDEWAAGGSSG